MPRLLKFDKLGRFYILALSAIAFSILFSQLVVQNYIGKQQNYSRTINVAGRQRMLSQKISKIALQLAYFQNTDSQKPLLTDLQETLDLWVQSHEGLLHGDEALGLPGTETEDILEMYKKVYPHYEPIVESVKSIIKKRLADPDSDIKEEVNVTLENEDSFLAAMDAIVFAYDTEAQAKIIRLKNIEVGLLILSLTIILIEFLFIFKPLAKNVRLTVADLIDSEAKSVKMAEEMSRLYEELVRSYQELESLNFETEPQQVYATINSKGSFQSISPAFAKLLGESMNSMPGSFPLLLQKNEFSDQFINDLLLLIENRQSWNGELKFTDSDGDFCWLELSIIPTEFKAKSEFKLIGRNITEIKEARIRSREINREKIEKKVREQQYRSVLILEGQEEERRRLGREMHDGIGQMLTALKLSIESITPTDSIHTKKRLQDTKSLMKSILQEVRRISFNLTPTSLVDFGIVPAVKKFCQEVNNFSAPEIAFQNKTSFVNRLDTHIESNIYRIVQEAVNNAIKYAKAKNINVSFEHSINLLTIKIIDDGKGFNYENLLNSGHFKRAGHGIFNMKERAAFVNADFNLSSEVGSGTEITIKLPLE